MFRLIGALISGLLIGLAARFLYPANVDMGLGMTILLGVGGSLLADLAVNRGRSTYSRPGCLASLVGAVALIFIGRHLGWH